MINCSEALRAAEHWANRFLTGAAAGSLTAIAGVAIMLLTGAI